jgi:hypothetical protein
MDNGRVYGLEQFLLHRGTTIQPATHPLFPGTSKEKSHLTENA